MPITKQDLTNLQSRALAAQADADRKLVEEFSTVFLPVFQKEADKGERYYFITIKPSAPRKLTCKDAVIVTVPDKASIISLAKYLKEIGFVADYCQEEQGDDYITIRW